MKKRFIIFYVATFCLVVGLSFAMPASSAILFYEDFEDALKIGNEWDPDVHGTGSQALTTEQIRAGSHAYKFSCTGSASDLVRQELTLWAGFNNGSLHFTVGNEYWTGFSIFLANGYLANGVVHHQYHGQPDQPPTCDPVEPWRTPVLAVAGTEGVLWQSYNNWDSRQCTPASGDYEGSYWEANDIFSTGRWYDFVINVKWSYGSDGFLKIWRDGVLVTDRTGPNCFNDNLGPYLKIGIYSGHVDQGQTITIYYDELRIGDSNSSYAEVAPGGSVKSLPPTSVKPLPPTNVEAK